MIFITGAASAGKTSLIKRLREQLPKDKFDIHDIDEADRWTDDYEGWRDAKIEYWLKYSIENKKKGIVTILCGIIFPAQVVKSPSYEAAQPVEYVLLDADANSIRKRFIARMEPRINRQIEISRELKTELKSLENKQIIDTTGQPLEDILESVIRRLTSLSPE